MTEELSNFERYLRYRRPVDFQFRQGDKTFVWVPDGKGAFYTAEVLKEEGDMVKVLITETGQQASFNKNKEVFPMNPPKFDGVDDCAALSNLNEPAVLYNLKLRYDVDIIYTYSGLFCVVINPYKQIPIYTQEIIEHYAGKRRDEVPPHVFAMADGAYRAMIQDKKNQSMLVTGESGAGKTENTKKIIQYLAAIAGRGGTEGYLERQLLQANPLLEALGNAKTNKNNNSSRFGKFIKITFDKSGFISGASIVSYLLEKNRVVKQGQGERCFHIFYQLMAGLTSTDKAKYKLTKPEDFAFLSQSNCTTVRGVDDAKEFEATCQALETLNFKPEERDMMWRVIAAICHMGNLPIVADGPDASVLKDRTELEIAAELLKVDAKQLEDGILRPRIKVGNKEVVQTRLSELKAKASRDALCKALYGRMFLWVVDKINQALQVVPKDLFIGLLDIAGFEIFQSNSFEQLCINYTNEKLQQFFNHHMFTLEQEEYKREKIDWQFIDFGIDSQATIDLIEKRPKGILILLDEESVFPKATDATFLAKLHEAHDGRHPKYRRPRVGKEVNFSIVHYAGEVEYDTTGWLEKNRDPLQLDLELTIKASKDTKLAEIFSSYSMNPEVPGSKGSQSARRGGTGAAFITVAAQYREQLSDLMETLTATNPHFIRCIIPNHKQLPGKIDDRIVLDQLRCNGVLEGIRISRKGWPNRVLYPDFLKRYYILTTNVPRRAADSKAACQAILEQLVQRKIVDPNQYRMGLTKVFFKAGQLAAIEEARERKVGEIIPVIQAACRGYIARKIYKKKREKSVAAQVIQRNIRAWLEFKNWPWYKLFVKARPLLKHRNVEEELKQKDDEIKKLQESLKAETEAKNALQKTIDNLKAQIEDITRQLQAAKKKYDDLEGEKAEVEEARKNLQRRVDELQEELNEKNEQLGKLQQNNAELSNKIKQLQGELDKETAEKNVLAKEKQRAEDEIKNLKERLAEEEDHVAKLQEEKKKLEADLDEAINSRDSEATAKDALMRQRKKLQDQVDELNAKLAEEAKARQNLEKNIKALEAELANTRHNLENESGLRAQAEDKIKNLEAQLSKLREDLDEQTKNRIAAEKQVKALQAQLDDLQHSYDALAKEKGDLAGKLRAALEDLDNTQGQLENETRERENLQSIKTKLEAAVDDLKRQLDEAFAKIGKLEREKAALQQELKSLQEQLGDESKKANDLAKSKRALEQELDDLRQHAESLENRLNNETKNRTKLEADLKAMQRQLEEEAARSANHEKNARRLAGELEAAKSEIESETKARAAADKGRKDLQARLAETEEQLEAERNARAGAEKKIQQLLEELDNARKAIEEAGKRVDDAEVKRLVGERDQLKLALDEESRRLQDALNQIKKLKGDIEDLTARCDDAERELGKAAKTRQRLESDIRELNVTINSQLATIERQDTLLRRLQDELEGLKLLNRDLDVKANRLQGQLVDEINEKNKYSKERSILQDVIRDLRARLVQEESLVAKLQDAKMKLSEQLEQSQSVREAEANARIALEKEINSLKTQLRELQYQKDTPINRLTRQLLKLNQADNAEKTELRGAELLSVLGDFARRAGSGQDVSPLLDTLPSTTVGVQFDNEADEQLAVLAIEAVNLVRKKGLSDPALIQFFASLAQQFEGKKAPEKASPALSRADSRSEQQPKAEPKVEPRVEVPKPEAPKAEAPKTTETPQRAAAAAPKSASRTEATPSSATRRQPPSQAQTDTKK
jgi:myosin heavy subunit